MNYLLSSFSKAFLEELSTAAKKDAQESYWVVSHWKAHMRLYQDAIHVFERQQCDETHVADFSHVYAVCFTFTFTESNYFSYGKPTMFLILGCRENTA